MENSDSDVSSFAGTAFIFIGMNFFQVISILPLAFFGIAAVISLRAFTHHFPIHFKILSVLWCLHFAVDLAGHITSMMHIYNHWLYNILNMFLYPTLMYVYQRQLQNACIRKLISVFYFGFIAFVIVNSLFIQGIASLQTLTIVVGGSLIIFLAGTYFWELYMSEATEKISKDPFFWFSFGFILYFGGTLPFLGMLNYLWERNEEFTTFYYKYISNAFAILLNVLIVIGFLCRKNYQRSF